MAHPGGRPLKYKSLEVMQPLIDEYFLSTPVNQLTITGLALALDTDRHTLINYGEREEFYHAIKKAKTKVENAYELSLRVNGRSGDIFGLKNFGWTDKTEVDTTISGQLDTGIADPKVAAEFAAYLKDRTKA